jgi:hypothetical protein
MTKGTVPPTPKNKENVAVDSKPIGINFTQSKVNQTQSQVKTSARRAQKPLQTQDTARSKSILQKKQTSLMSPKSDKKVSFATAVSIRKQQTKA